MKKWIILALALASCDSQTNPTEVVSSWNHSSSLSLSSSSVSLSYGSSSEALDSVTFPLSTTISSSWTQQSSSSTGSISSQAFSSSSLHSFTLSGCTSDSLRCVVVSSDSVKNVSRITTKNDFTDLYSGKIISSQITSDSACFEYKALSVSGVQCFYKGYLGDWTVFTDKLKREYFSFIKP